MTQTDLMKLVRKKIIEKDYKAPASENFFEMRKKRPKHMIALKSEKQSN